MSLLKLECPICFHEDASFKVLDCGHHFCTKCVDQLRNVSVCSSGSVSSMCLPSEMESQNQKTKDMECPQCRRITPATSLLKPKFMGTLLCRQCDEEKIVEEFRWCIQCSIAICSKCFVDKHMSINTEGIMCLHPACKWDADFPAAKYCIEQLKREANGLNDQITNTQNYAKSYLEGFQEYLFREIEQKIRSSAAQTYESKISAISEAYGVDAKNLAPADQSNKNYDVIVADLFKVAKIQNSSHEVLSETQLKLKCLPYKDMAQILLGGQINQNSIPADSVSNSLRSSLSTVHKATLIEPESEPMDIQNTPVNGDVPPPIGFVVPQSSVTETSAQRHSSVIAPEPGANYYPVYPPIPGFLPSVSNGRPTAPSNDLYDAMKGAENLLDPEMISRKFANPCIIGTNVIHQPSDMCYVPNLDTLLITDFVGGIFSYSVNNQILMQVPKVDRRHYHHYSRITLLPENLIGIAAMVNVHIGAIWCYTIVGVRPNGVAEQIKLPGKNAYHCSFPTKLNPTVASSARSLFCLSSKTLHRLSWPEDNEWKDVHTVHADNPYTHQHSRLGPILDRTDCTIIFMTNGAWQSVDVITLSYPENKVSSTRRIKLQSLFPQGSLISIVDPYLVKLNDKGDLLLLSDKKQTTVYAWNRSNETLMEWNNFLNRVPQKIICSQSILSILWQQKEPPFSRSLEMIRI